MTFTINFIGRPPEDIDSYLSQLYSLVEDAAKGDPGEAQEPLSRRE